MIYLQDVVNATVSVKLSRSYSCTSPLTLPCSKTFRLEIIDGTRIDRVKGAIMCNGSKNPINIWEQNVLRIINVPLIKL